MKASYSKWRKRLAGEKVETFTEPDENDCGFYRLPIREKKPNGQWKVLGYQPVALYVANDQINGAHLIALIGTRIMTGHRIGEQWPWFVSHPITEELFRRVTDHGDDWPDFPIETVPAANREVTAADNEPTADPDQPLDVQHAAAIDAAIGAAIRLVTNEEEAAQALGSKNRIAELRLAADKAGKAIYQPLYREYTAEQKKWSPIIARAELAEKRLNTAILTYREAERKRIAAEQAEAERKQRENDEANERAAQRAIARGEPEPEPVVEPELLVATAPAPVVPTYGTRKLKEELRKFVIIDDYNAVFQQFKGDPRVIELLTKLAQVEIDAGRNVPGTHYREGLV